jgi:hypothetical protein
MASIDRYHKYISVGEHVVVAGIALAAVNILVTDGFSGVRLAALLCFRFQADTGCITAIERFC